MELTRPTAWRYELWRAGGYIPTLLPKTPLATALLLFTTAGAWAQDDGTDQYGQVAPPDMWSTYGERILILVAAGAVGFAVGAFFSPLLKPFHKFIWLGLLAVVVLYALFGLSPNADILDGFVGLCCINSVRLQNAMSIVTYQSGR